MRWEEIKENASAGATGSASVATVVGGLGAGFDPNGDKGIYQSAKNQKSKKPLVIRRVNEDQQNRMVSFGTLCKVAVNMPDADFWLQRNGTTKTVGTPTKTFSADNIGIKVTRTDMLDPNYLFYMMQYWQQKGVFEKMATGSLVLVHISVAKIKAININLG